MISLLIETTDNSGFKMTIEEKGRNINIFIVSSFRRYYGKLDMTVTVAEVN